MLITEPGRQTDTLLQCCVKGKSTALLQAYLHREFCYVITVDSNTMFVEDVLFLLYGAKKPNISTCFFKVARCRGVRPFPPLFSFLTALRYWERRDCIRVVTYFTEKEEKDKLTLTLTLWTTGNPLITILMWTHTCKYELVCLDPNHRVRRLKCIFTCMGPYQFYYISI